MALKLNVLLSIEEEFKSIKDRFLQWWIYIQELYIEFKKNIDCNDMEKVFNLLDSIDNSMFEFGLIITTAKPDINDHGKYKAWSDFLTEIPKPPDIREMIDNRFCTMKERIYSMAKLQHCPDNKELYETIEKKVNSAWIKHTMNICMCSLMGHINFIKNNNEIISKIMQ
jgi:hypothetical protein